MSERAVTPTSRSVANSGPLFCVLLVLVLSGCVSTSYVNSPYVDIEAILHTGASISRAGTIVRGTNTILELRRTDAVGLMLGQPDAQADRFLMLLPEEPAPGVYRLSPAAGSVQYSGSRLGGPPWVAGPAAQCSAEVRVRRERELYLIADLNLVLELRSATSDRRERRRIVVRGPFVFEAGDAPLNMPDLDPAVLHAPRSSLAAQLQVLPAQEADPSLQEAKLAAQLPVWNEASMKSPDDPVPYCRMAQCLMGLGRYDEGYQCAKAGMEKFIERNDEQAWILLGTVNCLQYRVDVRFNMGPSERHPPETGVIRPVSFWVSTKEKGSRLLGVFELRIGLTDGRPTTAVIGETTDAGYVDHVSLDPGEEFSTVMREVLDIVGKRVQTR